MLLGYGDARQLAKKYRMPLVRGKCFNTLDEAKDIARKLKPPFVLKVLGPGVMHKTEKRLIALNLESLDEISVAMDRLSRNAAGMDVDCFLMQEQRRGVELIIGGKRDPAFGAIVLFGSGGIMAELYGDVAMRAAPLARKDALEMIAETKARAFFSEKGFRGRKACEDCVVKLLLGTSRLMLGEPQVKELDFNPVIADTREAAIVDARIIV
ncbi:acetyl-CoA synthetase [Candidatus Micrarchaeota archaeon CG10_big_fil_rev_8_21_14_0_10_59_7]|nr:MAG: acetyl-CoA synthetase [Candidatus Micrarchaeota archaeon CG10_big_fil_rev_8_21_14_0_10_59_7]